MKKRSVNTILLYILISSVLFSLSITAFPQKYEVGKISLKFIDKERGKRRVPADIYYPVDSLRNDSDTYPDISEKFPVICFGHGYLISGEWYAHIRDILVPEGFIMIFPGSEAGLFPSHKTLAKDMNFALNEIGKLNQDKTSPLFDRIDTVKCMMGHSMGGGSLMLASKQSRDATAIVALAPFDTRPSAIKAASSVIVPTLIFAGSNDCITPPEKHQLPVYNSSASPDKIYILIKGGTHCQMGVSHPKCSSAEKVAGCRGINISGDEQLKILARYILPWLRFHLYKDNEAGNQFNTALKNDPAIEYKQSRPLQTIGKELLQN